MNDFPWLTIIVVLPIFAGTFIFFFPHRGNKVIRWYTICICLLELLLMAYVFCYHFQLDDPLIQLEQDYKWINFFDFHWRLGIDGLSIGPILLTGFITTLATLAAWPVTRDSKLFHFLMLAMYSGQIGLFSSRDLLLFFIMWELELIPVYLLLSMWGGKKRLYSATKFILYTAGGSIFLLMGVLGMGLYGSNEPTLNFETLANQPYPVALEILFYFGFLIAYAIKLPIIPLHTWLPDTHGEAHYSTCMLLAGILLKMGAYGLVRINMELLPHAHSIFSPWLMIVGAIQIIYAALASLGQRNLKKRIAYSSVSHMGFIIIGISSITDTGLNGALLQMISHGFIGAALFFLAGTSYDRTRLVYLDEMGGITIPMPKIFTMFSSFSLASLALPGMITIHIHYSNWITKESLYSKLSLVDLAGSEGLNVDSSGVRVTDLLHVMKSLSALGDVLSSLTSKKDIIPYGNSRLTKILEDSLGGNSKTLLIVNICPNASNLSETLSALNFAARARNSELSLGNRDTIKKWRDIANDARKQLHDKESEVNGLTQEALGLKVALQDANDQCVLLFNEVQKAWKVSFTLQEDLKAENLLLTEKLKIEKEQNAQLRNQVANILQLEKDQKLQIEQRDSTIQALQAKIKGIESQLNESLNSRDARSVVGSDSGSVGPLTLSTMTGDGADTSVVTKKLEEELSKRDALIERLHEENEKLFDRLTEKASLAGSPQISSPATKQLPNFQTRDSVRSDDSKGHAANVLSLPSVPDKTDGTVALVRSGPEKGKTTPAGEYLTAALMDFDPEQYDGLAAIADGANKLLMLVLAAVIKAGAAREHEILAEIRDAVFSFIRKMEPRRVMDTMLVSRVRILYIRSLLAKSPELQSIKVSPVERFLEKANTGRSRSSSRGSSPGRSPVHYDSRMSLADENMHGFRVNIKQDKKSKFSSIVLKLRGVDQQETWRQHVTGGKLREITEEAKGFAIGNKALAALFVHTPAGELQRQIRSWLAENFEFLSVTGGDATVGTTGQLELLSTAIMDGWMAGLGAALPPNTDALGQLLAEYSKRVYTSQMQHLKDIAGTLAMEEAEDTAQVSKLRSALESVDHKRRKILQQMRSDTALLTLEQGGSPIQNPSTAAEDARLASLISLDGILKHVKDTLRQASGNSLTKSKKRAMLASLDELEERMPSLLEIDHPCAQRQIADARSVVESIPEQDDQMADDGGALQQSGDWSSGAEINVTQWNVLQFNTGKTNPFIIKCGANSNSELVIKADARVQDPKGGEIVRVVPRPTILTNMSLEEMQQVFSQLPEALSLLALAKTADGTRARFSRLYRTLAMKVPSLRDLVSELEKGGVLKDVKS